MNYIISHDVGTQSNKAVLISTEGKVHKVCEKDYAVHYPRPGWVEQDPEDYWQAICYTTREIASQLAEGDQILAMVFSTQAMGIIPVSESGSVLHRNISWVDSRADEQAEIISRRMLGKKVFKALTGVELSGKDVIPKLRWIKDKLPEVYDQTHKFLDVNGYLKFKCTGKMVAEWSGACSYGFNLKRKDWERLFFRFSGIDTDKLPDLVRSTDLIGNLHEAAATELGLTTDVSVYGGCDDTQSAAMGSGQIGDQKAHIYLGTSAWIGLSSKKNHRFKAGVASLQSADPSSSLLVGITESAGANIEWALEHFYKKEKEQGLNVYKLMEQEVEKVPSGADQLIFTPWFQGERTPVTNTTVRSTMFNLGFEHQRGHIMCALLEGIGYNLKWTIDNIHSNYGIKIEEATVIGGGSKNETWIQSLSDILQIRLHITEQPKMAGAIGCAMTALVGLKECDDFSKVTNFNPTVKTFEPRKEKKEIYQRMYNQYRSVYFNLKATYQQFNKERFSQV